MRQVVITGAARTPMGGFQGAFSDLTAADLGGAAIKAAIAGAGGPQVQELLMGASCLQAKVRHPRVRPDLPLDWAKMCPRQHSTRCVAPG